jgi:hypothetical protein
MPGSVEGFDAGAYALSMRRALAMLDSMGQ